jgi:acetylornithine/N-succinyldiaminopimelate aminotransferase
LLLALELRRLDAERVVEAARAEGLLVNAPQPTSLRFVPSLTVSEDELALMLDILDHVIERENGGVLT